MITEIEYIAIPFAGATGLCLFSAGRFCINSLFFDESVRKLSASTNKKIESVSAIVEEVEASRLAAKAIPFRDIISIYLNSRNDRRTINCVYVQRPCKECDFLLRKILRDHTRIKSVAKRAFIAYAASLFFPNRKSESTGMLLWYYSEQQELMNTLAECCPEKDRPFIAARVS